MQEQQEILCELWPEEQVEIQSHSRLYSLEPIGVGSPMVESLTSYLTRLAEAHSVPLYKLFLQEILPQFNTIKEDYIVPRDLTGLWSKCSALNGVTDLARNHVHALELLTIRSDLNFLTMLKWADVLPPRGLIRRTRAWCPSCYEAWRNSGQIVYDPLIWALEVVTICPKHHQKLCLRCPYHDCQHEQFHFTSRYVSGYCSWCRRWLGSNTRTDEENLTTLESERTYQSWIYKMVGEMLSAAPNLPILPSKSNLTAVFTQSINESTGGSQKAFSRQFHIPLSSIRNWNRGKHTPTMGNLLKICYQLGISPLSFITGDKEHLKYSFIEFTAESAVPNTMGKKRRKFEIDQVRSVLLSVLQDQPNPPPSMREVARGLGYNYSQIIRKFPDLCKAISARYLLFLSQKRRATIQRDCDKVREAMLILHAQECYPSLRQVGKLLKNSSILKDPHVYNAWKEMLKELGYM
jgi:DNA-binding transcriptional regulator YiaG